MEEIIKARMWQKTDTEAAWMANPLVLGKGEIAVVMTGDGSSFNMKIGSGTKTFADLPYYFDGAINAMPLMNDGASLPTQDNEGNPLEAGDWTILGEGTYTNVGGGSDIVIPAANIGIVFFDGTSWVLGSVVNTGQDLSPYALRSDVDAVVGSKVSKDELFAEYTLNHLPWLGGYYRDSATSLNDPLSSPPVSGAESSTYMFVPEGRQLIITGFNDIPTVTAGKEIAPDGTFLRNLTAADFTDNGDGTHTYDVVEAAADRVLFTVVAADQPGFSVRVGEGLLQIKPELIDRRLSTYINDAGFLDSISGVTSAELFNFQPGSDIPITYLAGYYHSSTTSLSDPLTTTGTAFSTEPIPIGSNRAFFLYNYNNPPASSYGKVVAVSGEFLRNLTAGDFLDLGGGIYQLGIEDAGAVSVLFTVLPVDQSAFSVSGSSAGQPKIKETLIEGFVKSDELFDGGGVLSFTWLDGYYHSTTADSLDDPLSNSSPNFPRSTSPIPIPASRQVLITGMNNPPASTFGKIILPDGTFSDNLTAGDFTDLGGGSYQLNVTDGAADRVLFTTIAVDQPGFAAYDPSDPPLIKPILLPPVSGTDSSAEMYLRGLDRNKYNTGSYAIFASGQSNQEGREAEANLPATLPSELTNVKLYNRVNSSYQNAQLGVNTGAYSNSESRWGYDWGVYKRLADYKAQDIYVTKRTRGGTTLASNVPPTGYSLNARFENITPGATAVTQQAETMMLNSFQVAESGSLDLVYKCVLWCHGEAAANDPSWAAAYYENLRDWIAYVRGIIGNPTIPVIVLTVHQDSSQYSQTVRDAQLKIGGKLFEWNGSAVAELPHTGEDPFVWVYNQDAHPWTTIGDDLHMDATLNELVAADVFEIIKDL